MLLYRTVTFDIAVVFALGNILAILYTEICLQCFLLLVGWQEGHPACIKLSVGVLALLSVWGEVQICVWSS